MNDIDYKEILHDALNLEIARETLREINPSIEDSVVEEVYSCCQGNPYNAVPLYKIFQMMGTL